MTTISAVTANFPIERIGWTLLHFLWQGAAIAVLFAVAMAILRKRAPAVRYAVACAALALMAAMPVATIFFVRTEPKPVVRVQITETQAGAEGGREAAALSPVSFTTGGSSAAAAEELRTPTTPAAARNFSWLSRMPSIIRPWLPLCVLIWLVGVAAQSLRLGIGWMKLARLRKSVAETTDGVREMFNRCVRQIGIGRRVALVLSPLARQPMTIGWLKPVVLLPASALAHLPPEQIEAILLHELAHVKRYDYLVNLIQTVVETILFYHPAVHWVSHRIRVERELCCDDLAVRHCGNARAYSKALASVAEIQLETPILAPTAGYALLHRISRLLRPEREKEEAGKWTVIIALLFLLLASGVGVTASNPKQQAASNGPQNTETTIVVPVQGPKSAGQEEWSLRTYDVADLIEGKGKSREFFIADVKRVMAEKEWGNFGTAEEAKGEVKPFFWMRDQFMMVNAPEKTHKELEEFLTQLRFFPYYVTPEQYRQMIIDEIKKSLPAEGSIENIKLQTMDQYFSQLPHAERAKFGRSDFVLTFSATCPAQYEVSALETVLPRALLAARIRVLGETEAEEGFAPFSHVKHGVISIIVGPASAAKVLQTDFKVGMPVYGQLHETLMSAFEKHQQPGVTEMMSKGPVPKNGITLEAKIISVGPDAGEETALFPSSPEVKTITAADAAAILRNVAHSKQMALLSSPRITVPEGERGEATSTITGTYVSGYEMSGPNAVPKVAKYDAGQMTFAAMAKSIGDEVLVESLSLKVVRATLAPAKMKVQAGGETMDVAVSTPMTATFSVGPLEGMRLKETEALFVPISGFEKQLPRPGDGKFESTATPREKLFAVITAKKVAIEKPGPGAQ